MNDVKSLIDKLDIKDVEIDEGRKRVTFDYYEDFMVAYTELVGSDSKPNRADLRRSGVGGEISLHMLGFEYDDWYIVGNTLSHRL